MAKAKVLKIEDIEQIVENKLLEFLGDPDSGLKLKPEFKSKLKERLKNTSKNISHKELIKRFD